MDYLIATIVFSCSATCFLSPNSNKFHNISMLLNNSLTEINN